jgi:hypothetical protein
MDKKLARQCARAAVAWRKFIVGAHSAREYAFVSALQDKLMHAHAPGTIAHERARANMYGALAYSFETGRLAP